MRFQRGRISKRRLLSKRHFILEIETEGDIGEVAAGQFCMLRLEGVLDPLLPRPFAYFRLKRNDAKGRDAFEVLIQRVGKGTQAFLQAPSGSSLSVLGPLGKGFTIEDSNLTHILVAGGIGLAGLGLLTEQLTRLPGNPEILLLFGSRTAEATALLEEFRGYPIQIAAATEDGSVVKKVSTYIKGTVMELLSRIAPMKGERASRIYACGPEGMLKEVALFARERGIEAEVLLEERMACGIGPCWGCVVEVRSEDGTPTYERVCQEGPVFPASKVIFR